MRHRSRLLAEYTATQRRVLPADDLQNVPRLSPAEQLLFDWAVLAAEEYGRDAASVRAAPNDAIVRLYEDELEPPWLGTAIVRVGNFLYAITDPRVRRGEITATEATAGDATQPIVAFRLLVNLEMLHRWGYLDYDWPGSLFELPPGLIVQPYAKETRP